MNDIVGIIPAAGMGTRLREITSNTPKAIVEVGDQPLIWYSIEFMRKVGIKRIIVVGGFEFDKLKKVVQGIDGKIEILENTEYKKGNLLTLEKALGHVDHEGFLMTHVDHIFSSDIVEKVANQLHDEITIFTDNDRKLGADDMKVETDESGRLLRKVSKDLDDYTLGYVGLTYCPSNYVGEYKEIIKKVKEAHGERAVTEQAMQMVANLKEKDIFIGDISGSRWLEIDTVEELGRAEKEIQINNFLY